MASPAVEELKRLQDQGGDDDYVASLAKNVPGELSMASRMLLEPGGNSMYLDDRREPMSVSSLLSQGVAELTHVLDKYVPGRRAVQDLMWGAKAEPQEIDEAIRKAEPNPRRIPGEEYMQGAETDKLSRAAGYNDLANAPTPAVPDMLASNFKMKRRRQE